MVTENIKKFNKCAAEIFDYLYPKFPVESDIRVDDFKDYTNEENRPLFFSTIRFLKREGFIQCSSFYGGFSGVVLTCKGFAVLNSTPAAIEKTEPLGMRIGKAIKSGSQEIISGVIQEAIKSFALGQF